MPPRVPCLAVAALLIACSALRAQYFYENSDIGLAPHPVGNEKTIRLEGLPLEVSAVASGDRPILRVSTTELKPHSWLVAARAESLRAVTRVEFRRHAMVPLNRIAGMQHYDGDLVRDVQSRGSIPYWKYEFGTGPQAARDSS
jgi:hypothetical protein